MHDTVRYLAHLHRKTVECNVQPSPCALSKKSRCVPKADRTARWHCLQKVISSCALNNKITQVRQLMRFSSLLRYLRHWVRGRDTPHILKVRLRLLTCVVVRENIAGVPFPRGQGLHCLRAASKFYHMDTSPMFPDRVSLLTSSSICCVCIEARTEVCPYGPTMKTLSRQSLSALCTSSDMRLTTTIPESPRARFQSASISSQTLRRSGRRRFRTGYRLCPLRPAISASRSAQERAMQHSEFETTAHLGTCWQH